MYKIEYFAKGHGMSSNDLDNPRQIEHLNLRFISSVSGIMEFHLPLSGDYKVNYAVVSMVNGDRFYIDEIEHKKLMEALKLN